MWFFTPEEQELQAICRDFAQKELAPYAHQHDEAETFNLTAFRKMGQLGVLGITAAPEYGGAGLGATAATIVMEEFGRTCASSALSYLAHSILVVNNIQANASSEQKRHYLPKLITGEWIGSLAMSEPDFGSDAIGLQTRAAFRQDHYKITGTKMWITNAQYADILYVYTRTGEERKNLTTFILEKALGQFTIGKPIKKMGMRASPTNEVIFDGVRVPCKQRVGEEGHSTYQMMKNLEIERITIAGISLGIAQACVDQCLKYAIERRQFGEKIGKYQMIQQMIAEMSTQTEMMRHYLYSVAKAYDQGKSTGPVGAAMVKLAIPKQATKIALDAIQIHGGYGYSREFPLERYLRDNKLNEIGAGTNEVMVLIIAKNLLQKQAQAMGTVF